MSTKVSTESVKHTNNQVATSSNQNEVSEADSFYPPDTSVCVCPLPKSVTRNELVCFLHQFGAVKREQFTRKSFIIQYYNSKPVEMLLSKTHWIQREKLCLKKGISLNEVVPKNKAKQARMQAKKDAEDADPISYRHISPILENEVSFDKELMVLLNEIQLSDAELLSRYKVICPHLNEIFISVFPECQTFSFGSTVAGLSFKECDLDIYMYLGNAGLPPIYNQPSESQQLLTLMIFKKVKKLMYSMRYVFSNIIGIPKAKTPIIKFRYLPTNVSCDISFKNGLGVYKSHFLKYCAQRDVRLKPLMLLIKYWAKHLEITGGGRISNYGLVCLVIFFLQQNNLLPPLLELQKDYAPLIINGWQVNFNEKTTLPPSSNGSTIPKLFHDFVHFYADFNFKSSVLCLLDGKVHPASDFAQVHKLPDYMHRYKNYVLESQGNAKKLDIERPMIVQDPFELDQNTTGITPERVKIAFQRYCAFSVDICQSTSKNNYDNLLKSLFGTALPNMIPPKKKRKTYKNVIYANLLLKAGLPANFEERTDIYDKEMYIKNNWYHVVFNLIRDIYEMVFKLNVEVILDEEMKQQKIEALSNVHTDLCQKIMLHCTGGKCVWKNRKKSNRTSLDVQLSPLEKEAIVSDKVLELIKEQNDTADMLLNFSCLLERTRPHVGVTMTIKDESTNSNKNTFHQFEYFVDSIMSKLIESTLLHMLQFQKTYSQLRSKQPSSSSSSPQS